MKEKLINIIIEETNLLLDEPIDDLNENSYLFGEEGILDSMELVSMIVAVEQIVEDIFDKQITIVNAKAMSLKNSPFRTVASLADYVEQLVKE